MLIFSIIFRAPNLNKLQGTRQKLTIILLIDATIQTIYFTNDIIFENQYSINLLFPQRMHIISTLKPAFYFIVLDDFQLKAKQLLGIKVATPNANENVSNKSQNVP